MVELNLHDVVWSRERGHPLVVLRVDGQEPEFLSIVVSPDDAQGLALAAPCCCGERTRLFGFVESLLAAVDARVTGVDFRLSGPTTLSASVEIEGARGRTTLPANFADAVTLAVRARAPLRIAEADLRFVKPARGGQRPAAFQSFIESLNLTGIGDEGPSDGSAQGKGS